MSDTPSTRARQQREAARFRSAVSEALLQQMQGNLNFLLGAVLPVGSMVHSMLTEAQFQAQTSTGWVLSDGRNVAASDYAILTGFTTVPDARGVHLRGKNHGRSTATGNDEGDLALGSYQEDANKIHRHVASNVPEFRFINSNIEADGVIVRDEGSEYRIGASSATTADQGTESRPRNVTVNTFIRIN